MLRKDQFVQQLRAAKPECSSTLASERAQSPIDVPNLSLHIRGKHALERQECILNQLLQHKVFSKDRQANLSRPDRYRLGLARSKQLIRLHKEHNWTDDDFEMAMWLVGEMLPLMLRTMFRTTIKEQASDEQKKHWLPRIDNWEIIGTYSQTEMGHGSNVRGIEVEARYDIETKEFILHSPTLTSAKWWNGGLGRTANHAIVMAQLLLPSKDGAFQNLGPHPFVVQIRDLRSFEPLEGIAIGDIGPKLGYASMDNGYMLFDHFRVPHAALLSRYSQVEPETGRYVKPQNSNLIYGSLTHIRTLYAMSSRTTLARAVTIAIRYTAVRRQFSDHATENKAGGPSTEISVLDYPTVQIRLLPLLAACYALHYTGLEMAKLSQRARAKAEKGDFSDLPELHAVSSGLKARCTEIAANGIEICRRACGGHGYGGYSGFVQLNNDYLSKPTVEGDNWMIPQQNARYILKMVASVAKGSTPKAKTPESSALAQQLLQYHQLQSKASDTVSLFKDVGTLSTAFEHVTARLAFKIHHVSIVEHKSQNDLLIQRHELSALQSSAKIVRSFADAIASSNVPSTVKSILPDLLRLFAYTAIQQHMFEFQSAAFIDREELSRLPDEILAIMKRIRPHAVSLIDAFAIPDYQLESSLGRSDGNVYEDMFDRVSRLNPLNEITFNSDYQTDELEVGVNSGSNILSKL